MSESAGKDEGGGGSNARIGAKARAVFLRVLRRGASHQEAARAAGFSRSAFFRLRRRDAGFAASCEEAVETAARMAPRRGAPRRCRHCGCLPGPGEAAGESHAIRPARGRRLQRRRRSSRVEFTTARQDVFLAHFAGTCNLAEAAEVAAVSESTVSKRLDRDPDFAERFQAVLAQSYRHLETELLRHRLEAQKRLGSAEATGALEPEFDRALKLLERWERKDGSLGPRRQVRAAREPHSFDEAIDAMERKLKAIGIPIRDFRLDDEGGDSHFNAPPHPDDRSAGESDCPPDADGDSHFIGPPRPHDRSVGESDCPLDPGGDSHFNAPPQPDDRSAGESDCPPGADGDSHFNAPPRPDDRSVGESDCPLDPGGDSHFIGPRRPSDDAGA
jgi:hypothetical protein